MTDNPDIVERLRENQHVITQYTPMRLEAADEITRLRAEVGRLESSGLKEMANFIRALENDNNAIPEWLWAWRNSIVSRLPAPPEAR